MSAFLITSVSLFVINFLGNITETIFYKLDTSKDSGLETTFYKDIEILCFVLR